MKVVVHGMVVKVVLLNAEARSAATVDVYSGRGRREELDLVRILS